MFPNVGGFGDNFFNIKSCPQNHPGIDDLYFNGLITSLYIYTDYIKIMFQTWAALGTTFSTPKVVPNTTSLFFYMDYVWTIIQISSTFQLKKWWLPLIWHVRRIYHLASDGKSNFGSSSIRDMNIPYYQMSQPSSKGFNLSPFDDNNWLHHLQNVILLMKSDR